MTPGQEYANGVAVGRMYAASPYWYWGFFLGQVLGAWQWWFRRQPVPGEWRPA